MKLNLIFLILVLITMSCSEREKPSVKKDALVMPPALVVPDQMIDQTMLTYDNKISIWSLQGVPFSGYVVTYLPDSTLIEKTGILRGKKQNTAMTWYPNGQLKTSENYHQGKLHGEKKVWTFGTPPVLVADLNYHLGKVHGVQKKWYPSGEIFKIMNVNMGREEGIQQAYRKNGVLYTNYEARGGRIFGLKKAALCFELEEEKIQTKE